MRPLYRVVSMLENYFSVFVFIVIGLLFGLMPMILSALLSPKKANAQKMAPYECGFPPFEDARIKFDVQFYLIAIFFIIFDLEIAFLFPWALVVHKVGWQGLLAVGIFLAILVLGLVYEWKKGALEWR
jgi:NADH-quinone oxidoreductase subunit A